MKRKRKKDGAKWLKRCKLQPQDHCGSHCGRHCGGHPCGDLVVIMWSFWLKARGGHRCGLLW